MLTCVAPSVSITITPWSETMIVSGTLLLTSQLQPAQGPQLWTQSSTIQSSMWTLTSHINSGVSAFLYSNSSHVLLLKLTLWHVLVSISYFSTYSPMDMKQLWLKLFHINYFWWLPTVKCLAFTILDKSWLGSCRPSEQISSAGTRFQYQYALVTICKTNWSLSSYLCRGASLGWTDRRRNLDLWRRNQKVLTKNGQF